jgi:hypothetical protein
MELRRAAMHMSPIAHQAAVSECPLFRRFSGLSGHPQRSSIGRLESEGSHGQVGPEILRRITRPDHAGSRDDLQPEEQAHWIAIAAALPPDWFNGGSAPLLKQLCRHIHNADLLAKDIAQERRALAAGEPKARSALLRALRCHGFETDRIISLSTKLRLTKLSRYRRADAAYAAARDGSAHPALQRRRRSTDVMAQHTIAIAFDRADRGGSPYPRLGIRGAGPCSKPSGAADCAVEAARPVADGCRIPGIPSFRITEAISGEYGDATIRSSIQSVTISCSASRSASVKVTSVTFFGALFLPFFVGPSFLAI